MTCFKIFYKIRNLEFRVDDYVALFIDTADSYSFFLKICLS